MCLMLYIGTDEELPLLSSPDLKVEQVEPVRQVVRQWFSQPVVHFVGAHTGCSCGFPSVTDGGHRRLRILADDRRADLRSVRALMELLAQAMARGSRVELYPVADGDESKPPKGVIDWQLTALDPDRLFFNERFMHVVQNRESAGVR